MSFADTKEAIETRFQTQMIAARPGITIFYENVPAEQPEREGHVRISFTESQGKRESIGSLTNAIVRYRGLVVVSIFVPERDGTVLAAEIADDVTPIFEEALFDLGNSGKIRCRIPRLLPIGRGVDGFWQSQVQTNYQRCTVG